MPVSQAIHGRTGKSTPTADLIIPRGVAVVMEMHDDWTVVRRYLAQVNNTPQEVPALEAVNERSVKKAV